jgi:hypothetical protein
LNNLGAGEAPHGISKVDTLYTLAKQAQALGAYKLARYACTLKREDAHEKEAHVCVRRETGLFVSKKKENSKERSFRSRLLSARLLSGPSALNGVFCVVVLCVC